MEKTDAGTSVGVDDPYAHAGVCDHLTDEGTCRFAFEHPEHDPEFARDRRADDFRCLVADADADSESDETASDDCRSAWAACPHYRCRNRDRACARCGLEERRMAHSDERPLLEEHHLSYAGELRASGDLAHEITVYLCRWCHAKVHTSWARIDDDATPDPDAIAEQEGRRSREQAETAFETAAERYDPEE